MKRFLTALLTLFALAQTLFAIPNNAILFTENGEKFQVVLNGILQNSNPETNVKLTELPAPNYKCKIIFSDKKLGTLDFNLIFNESGEELTMNIKQNKKGEYVTRYVSSIPIASAPKADAGQKIIVYTEKPASETTTVTTSTTTTTKSGSSNEDGNNINIQMGISMNEEGGNVDIMTSNPEMEDDIVITSTTTTTQVTTTTNSKGPSVVTAASLSDAIEYKGTVGCPNPMDIADFEMMKQTINANDFESTKLSIAKQVLLENCLLAGQVNEVLSLFEFENTKLEFAKYAYDYTFDIGNYFKVNEAFEFESSIEELNNYITAKN